MLLYSFDFFMFNIVVRFILIECLEWDADTIQAKVYYRSDHSHSCLLSSAHNLGNDFMEWSSFMTKRSLRH